MLGRSNDRRRNTSSQLKPGLCALVTLPRDENSLDYFQGGGDNNFRMTEALLQKAMLGKQDFVHEADSNFASFFRQVCIKNFGL